jgi:hypothetical protein
VHTQLDKSHLGHARLSGKQVGIVALLYCWRPRIHGLRGLLIVAFRRRRRLGRSGGLPR